MKTSVQFGAMRLSLSLFMVLILALGQANAQVDIRESFEDAVFPPSGWTETGSGSWMRVSAASGYPSNTGGFSAYCNGAGSYLITKPALVNPLDILSFWYRAESPAHPQNLDVLIGTNPALLTDTLYRISNNTNYAYTLVEVPLAAYTGQVVYIAFIGQTGAGAIFDYGILLDDVKVYGLPDCATLSSPANGAANAPVTAVLGWNAALEATGYRVYLGTNNPPDNILNGVDMGTALSHAPVLNYSTTYYWRVEPYNAIGAANCAVWSFTTGADPVIHAFPWTEEFSIWPPAGWDLSGGARNWAPYGGTAAYCNFWNWPSGTAVMTTPMLDLSTDGMLRFKWSHLPFPSANDKLEVAITESGSGVWNVLWEKSGNDLNSLDGATSLMPGTYKQETISIPVAYTGKTIQIRFSGTSGNGNNLFLDQVMVEFDPFLSVTAESINLCFGETGTLEAVARGGQKPYVYSWTPATGLGQPSAAITSAAPASTTTYNVVVTDALGSTAFASATVNVNPVLNASAFYNTTVCYNNLTQLYATATGGTAPYTYQWSNPGSISDPASASPFVFPSVPTVYDVTITDVQGCQASASVQVDVVATASANIYPVNPEICAGDIIRLTATGGTTYQWSSIPAGFNSTQASPFVYPLVTTQYIVKVTSACGIAYDTTTVTVHPLPVVTFAPLAGVCVSASPFVLTGGSPAGGIYSGPGVSSGMFIPAIAGAGLKTLTYTYTDLLGCTNSATQTIMVNPLPVVSFSGLAATYCVNNAPVILTGSPSGGTFSGSGISGNIFDPALAGAGIHIITYTYTDGNGCTNASTQNVTVYELPVISIINLPTTICITDLPVNIVGSAAPGGSFSGPGITNLGSGVALFNPIPAGLGTKTITYTYTDVNGCTNSVSQNITVHPAPNVTFSGLALSYCGNAAPVTLTGNQAPFGTFTGHGITDLGNGTAIFDPAVALTYFAFLNKHEIRYTYTSPVGCTNYYSLFVTVHPVPTINAGPDQTICLGNVAQLNAIPGGGTPPYSYAWNNGASLSNPAIRNPIASPIVTTTYTITISDANGCQNTDDITITVNDPVATVTDDTTCLGTAIMLQVIPSGGSAPYTYIWSPVAGLDNPFIQNPMANPATVGVHVYSVTITDAIGCSGSASLNLTVLPIPLAFNVTGGGSYCAPGAGIAVGLDNSETGVDYELYLDGLATGQIVSGTGSPISFGLQQTGGLYTVVGTLLSSGCPLEMNGSATVIAYPTPIGSATPTVQTVCSDVAITTIVLGTTNNVTGTTFAWTRDNTANATGIPASGSGNISGIFNNVTGIVQTVTFTVIPTSPDGCVGAPFTAVVNVRPEPLGIATPANQTVCSDVPIATIVLSTSNNLAGTTYAWTRDNNVDVTGMAANGTGDISGALNNVTGVDQVVTFTITPTSADGCQGDPFTATVTVHPEPVGVATPAAQTVCSDVTITTIVLSTSNNLAGTTYAWTRDNTANTTGLPASGTGDISGSFNNVTGTDQLVTFTIIPTSADGCLGDPFTATVTVHPEPVGVATPAAQTVCSDVAITTIVLTTSNNLPGTTYAWTRDNLVNATGFPASGTGNISGIFNNVTGTDQVVIFTIIPTSADGCLGDPFTATVTVHPEPVGVATPAAQTVCSDVAITTIVLSTSNNLAGTTYAWTRDNTANATGFPASGTGDISGVFNNVTSTDQVVTFTITPTSADGCLGDPFTATVTVHPEPVGVATPAAQTVCSDVAITTIVLTTSNNLPGTTYAWTRDNVVNATGIPASGTGDISGVLNNVTGTDQVVTFTITPTSADGCLGDPFTATVTVHPEPVGVATPAAQTVCSDVAITTIVLSTSNNLAGTTYAWTRDNLVNATGFPANGTGDISGVFNNVTGTDQVVTFTIIPTSADGCLGDPFTATVTVHPEPVGVATPAAQTVCSDVAITTIVLSTSNNLAGTTYAWTRDNTANATGFPASGTGDISGSFNNVTGTDQVVTFTITPTSADGCLGDPFTATVTVHPEPVGVATPATQTVCSDVAITTIVLTTSNNLPGTTYAWTRDNLVNATGIPASGTGDISGVLNNVTGTDQVVTFTITPTSADGCLGDPFTATVTVHPEPVGVATPAAQTVCSDVAITTIVLSTSNNLAGTTYAWTRDNTANATGFPASGTGDISGSFNNVTGTDQVVTFTIIPTSADGCLGDPFTATVTVHPEPVGVATPAAQTVCSDVTITTIVLSTSNNLVGTTYAWTRDNIVNVTGMAISGTGNISGALNNVTGTDQVVTFTIIPTSADGCLGDPFTATVTVHPEPVGVATPAAQTVCSDVAITTIVLSTSNNLAGTTYAWTRDNTANATGFPASGTGDISGVFNNVTGTDQVVTFTIIPTSADGCLGDPFTATVTVHPEPVGVATPAAQTVCSDVAITTIVLSTSNNLAGTTYAWTRDNTANATGFPASGTGNISGVFNNVTSTDQVVTFTIIPTSADGCLGDPFTATVTVHPEPVGVATPAAQTVCSDVAITTIVLTTSNNLPGTTYAWTRDNLVNATGIPASGTGDISGVLNNVTGTDQVVTFTITPTSADGCVGDPFTATVTVHPEPVGVATPAAQTVCSDVAITTIVLSTSNNLAGTTFAWTRDNTANATGFPASGTGNISGIFNNVTGTDQVVTFTIIPTSADGCLGDPFTATVTVHPEPVGVATPAAQTVCSDVAITTIVLSTSNNLAGTTYAWTRDNTANATGFPASGTGDISGSFNNVTGTDQVVTFTIIPTSADGCLGDPFTATVTVHPEPVGVATPAAQTVCSDVAITTIVLTTSNNLPGTTYAWTRDNLVNATGIPASGTGDISGVLNNVTGTDQVVTFTIIPTSADGCLGDPFTATVTVHPEPVGVATPAAQTVCSDVAITTIVLSTSNNLAGTTYAWTRDNTANATGFPASGTGDISGVFNNVTGTDQVVTFTIIPTSADGCLGDPFTATVTVHPEPVGVATPAAQTVCSDVTITTIVLSTSNNLVGTTYAWTRDNIVNVTGMATSGTGDISGALNNVTGTDQLVTFTIIPTSADGCLGDPFTATVTVHPEPVGVATPAAQTVCSDVAITTIVLTTSNNLAGTTFAWTRDNTANATGFPASGTGNISGIFNNVTGTDQVVIFTIIPTSADGCLGDPFTATVTVHPEPVGVATPAAQTVCSDVAITTIVLSTSNNLAGTTYAWTRDNLVNATGFPASGTGNISGVFNNVTSTDQVVTFTIIPTSADGCLGDPFTATVTVHPEPVGVATPAAQTVCSDVAITTIVLTTSNNLPGTTYAWTRDNLVNATGIPASGTGDISGVLNNVTGIDQVVTFTITPTSADGCLGDPFTATVTVHPEPVGVATPAAQTVCSDVAITTIVLSTSNNLAGTTYAWTRDNTANATGFPASGTGDISGIFNNVTGTDQVVTFTITPTSADGCLGDPFTATVTVHPEPVGVATPAAQTVCSDDVITTIVLTTSNNLAGTTYAWTRDNLLNATGIPTSGSGDISGILNNVTSSMQTVIFTITPVSVDGCTGDLFNAVVNVNPEPIGAAVPALQTVCSSVPVTTVVFSTVNNLPGSTFAWVRDNTANVTGMPASGSGDISGTLVNLTGVIQTVTFTVTPSSAIGCAGDPFTVVIVVEPEPFAYNINGGGSFCAGEIGVVVGLDGSQIGKLYQLMIDGVLSGPLVGGTGFAVTFGYQTTGGVYTILATDPVNGCTSIMNGSVTVTVNPLPAVYAMIGGGAYCSGGAGVDVGLAGSDLGVDYTLYLYGVNTGLTVSGTGTAISFGNQTLTGTYTVGAINVTTGCQQMMGGSVTVTISPKPIAFNVTGGGNYCTGGPGVVVGLDYSELGVDYELIRDGNNTGIVVNGTGSAISFGLQLLPGNYTVFATNTTNLCSSIMNGSVNIVVNALPVPYNVNGGGSYCAGGIGATVGLANSQPGVDYELYLDGFPTGQVVSGTGAAISFGSQTLTGTYTIIGTIVATGCINTMSGNALITLFPAPVVYNVTGGGSYCAGGAGVVVGLDGSQTGIDYELLLNGLPTGVIIPGNNSPASFPPQTAAGIYTVMATDTATSCQIMMTGSAAISIDPLPIAFIVSGSGSYCAGGSGFAVSLSGSEPGIVYTLWLDGVATTQAVGGTGSPVNFGLQTTAGTYTVSAFNPFTGCTNLMTGNAVITVWPLPVAFNVTGGGVFCGGGTGVAVGLDGSTAGILYQLQVDGVNTGSVVGGTGAALSFGLQTQPGVYTVIATDPLTNCTEDMIGSVTVTVNPLPQVFTVLGGGHYCAGGTAPAISLSGSEVGIQYILYLSGTPTPNILTGNGSALSFGPQAIPGIYTVKALNTVTLCEIMLPNSVSIVLDPLPTVYNVTGGGAYCQNGSGVMIGLQGSQAGVDYALYRDGFPIFQVVPGTGLAINFGLQTIAGNYTVIATDTTSGCSETMNGNAVVSIHINPVATAASNSPVCEGEAIELYGGGAGCELPLLYCNSSSTSWFQEHITQVSLNGAVKTSGGTTYSDYTNSLFTTLYRGSTYTLNVSNFVGGNFDQYVTAFIDWNRNGDFGDAGDSLYVGTWVGTHTFTKNITVPVTASVGYAKMRIINKWGGHPTACGTYTYGETEDYMIEIKDPAGPTCQYAWSGPNGFSSTQQYPVITPATAANGGLYTVTVTDAHGCTASATVNVVVNPLPVVTFTGLLNTYCTNDAPVTLVGTPAGGTFSGAGISGSGFYPAIAGSGTHIITYAYTNSLGCTNSFSQNVTVNTSPTAVISGDTSICMGGTAVVFASGGSTYLWSTGATTSAIFVSPVGTTTYTVTVTNAFGCTDVATATVFVDPVPLINAGGDVQICLGDDVQLNVTASGAGPVYGYNWNPVTGLNNPLIANPVASPTVTTTYVVTVTGSNGCTATDDVMVTVNPLPNPNAGPDITQCHGTTVTLTVTPAGMTYLWMPGNFTTQSITVLAGDTTTYFVTVTNSFGCSAVDSVTVSSWPLPTAVASPNQTICTGELAAITATGAGPGGSYAWTSIPAGYTANGAVQIVMPADTTYYIVTVTNSNGCTDMDTTIVNVNPKPVVNLGPDLTVCENYVVTLDAGLGFDNYLWSDGSNLSTYVVNPNGVSQPIGIATYSVTVTLNGCAAADYVNIEFVPCPGIEELAKDQVEINVYPNPTDGQFTVSMKGFDQDVEMQVLNNIGQLIYSERLKSAGMPVYNREFNLSNQPQGMYFLRFTDGTIVRTKKIIIH